LEAAFEIASEIKRCMDAGLEPDKTVNEKMALKVY
jgi:hypothetical protein